MASIYKNGPKIQINRGSSGGGGPASSVSFNVTRANHGFITADLPLAMFYTSTGWEPALADSDNTLATHIMVKVLNVNTYTLAQVGRFEIANHGLLVDNYYYVSSTQAGHLTATEPAYYSNPILFVEDSDYIHILPFRPSIVNGVFSGDTTEPESIFLHRDVDGNISSIEYETRPTLVINRDSEGTILTYTNGLHLWTINRDINEVITGITVT